MNIRVETLRHPKDISPLIFEGRSFAYTRKQTKAQLHEALKEDTILVIADLSQVSFIDSSGLSALVSALRLAREHNQELILTGLSRQAQMVFSLTMMDRIFEIYPSMEAALEGISS